MGWLWVFPVRVRSHSLQLVESVPRNTGEADEATIIDPRPKYTHVPKTLLITLPYVYGKIILYTPNDPSDLLGTCPLLEHVVHSTFTTLHIRNPDFGRPSILQHHLGCNTRHRRIDCVESCGTVYHDMAPQEVRTVFVPLDGMAAVG